MNRSSDIPSRQVSQVIHCTPQTVYDFAVNLENLPLWASGLAEGPATREGESLRVNSPMGTVTVRFVERNDLGVLDHDVTLPSGVTVNNPMRVHAHPDGAEVVLSVRQLELTDAEFERDLKIVARDLQTLKKLVED